MLEIGSEFHWTAVQYSDRKTAPWLVFGQDQILVFSGRTAIETVLLDIGSRVDTALLPSYCCSSMIDPFLKAGYRIRFYDVNYRNDRLSIDLQIPSECGILLYCSYFGFESVYPEKELSEFQKRGGIIIEDITHSLLSRRPHHSNSDYLVASLRKWGAVPSGGLCCKTDGSFFLHPSLEPETTFLETKLCAMKKKEAYLANKNIKEKQEFLSLFQKSNLWLGENYSGLVMDQQSKKLLYSWDIDKMREIRRENAHILYQGLKNHKYIKPLFPESSMDCPLFLPILIEQTVRDSVRQKLIENEIYCPVHWPCPNNECVSNLYDLELSLICDQRYDSNDMKRIISVLINY